MAAPWYEVHYSCLAILWVQAKSQAHTCLHTIKILLHGFPLPMAGSKNRTRFFEVESYPGGYAFGMSVDYIPVDPENFFVLKCLPKLAKVVHLWLGILQAYKTFCSRGLSHFSPRNTCIIQQIAQFRQNICPWYAFCMNFGAVHPTPIPPWLVCLIMLQ